MTLDDTSLPAFLRDLLRDDHSNSRILFGQPPAPRPSRKPMAPQKLGDLVLVPRHAWAGAYTALAGSGAPFEASVATNCRAVLVSTNAAGAGLLIDHHHAELAPGDVSTTVPMPPVAVEPHGDPARLRAIAGVLADAADASQEEVA